MRITSPNSTGLIIQQGSFKRSITDSSPDIRFIRQGYRRVSRDGKHPGTSTIYKSRTAVV